MTNKNEPLRINYDYSHYDYVTTGYSGFRIGRINKGGSNTFQAEYDRNGDKTLYIYVDGIRYTYDEIAEMVRHLKLFQ